MKRLFVLTPLLTLWITVAKSQQFQQYFNDETLRIDYIFSGNDSSAHIAVDRLYREPKWWGKRHRLAEVPIEGNGQIIMKSRKDGRIIYRNSFSTLFQEWQQTDEAKHAVKAYENVFLVPMPKDTVDITLQLMDNRRRVCASATHTVAPLDILIAKQGYEHVTPFITLQQAADTTNAIHLAFLAEGYTQNEMSTFITDCRTAMDALFAHEPFRSLKDKFNVIAVKAPSVDSGTSEPSRGIWKTTALSAHFNTNYSDRYLTTSRLSTMHNLLAGTPYEHILVLVNTSHYGGGGILNSYVLTTTHNQWFRPVVVHEFGHSFAGLADEYAYENEPIPMYPTDVEPWEKNITTKVDFHDKWESLIPTGAGFHEGAGYALKGVYRAYHNCRMRTNEYPEFCPACQLAIRNVIQFYTNN